MLGIGLRWWSEQEKTGQEGQREEKVTEKKMEKKTTQCWTGYERKEAEMCADVCRRCPLPRLLKKIPSYRRIGIAKPPPRGLVGRKVFLLVSLASDLLARLLSYPELFALPPSFYDIVHVLSAYDPRESGLFKWMWENLEDRQICFPTERARKRAC